jgi:hypothetical protein
MHALLQADFEKNFALLQGSIDTNVIS